MVARVQEIKDEAQDFYSDDDLFSVSSFGADLSFRELIDRYDDNELVKPELQRKYVWDKTEASRFIDSILLGLPVPSIFLAKTEDEKMLIVDGYQRIMTVYDYVRGIFNQDDRVFRLSRSEKINRRWRGKAFTELGDSEQRKIKNTTIHSIVFVQDHPSGSNTSMYQVFERINTSGRTLMSQEIRNCIYQGTFNSFLIDANKLPSWRRLFGSAVEDSRMRDIEFVLRYVSLGSDEFMAEQNERVSLKRFLNVFMGKHKNAGEARLAEYRESFVLTMNYLASVFGLSAFHNISTKNPDKLVDKFNPTIFDSVSIATRSALLRGRKIQHAKPEAARRELLRNEEYRGAISAETMRTENIRLRINLASRALFGVDYEQC